MWLHAPRGSPATARPRQAAQRRTYVFSISTRLSPRYIQFLDRAFYLPSSRGLRSAEPKFPSFSPLDRHRSSLSLCDQAQPIRRSPRQRLQGIGIHSELAFRMILEFFALPNGQRSIFTGPESNRNRCWKKHQAISEEASLYIVDSGLTWPEQYNSNVNHITF